MATITGLTNGMEYDVQVRAENSVGEGEWSDTASATPGAVPGKPVVSLSAGSTTITATWSEPASNGADISDYDVRYKLSSESSWDDWAHSGTGREATITGLTNGMGYDVQVRAENSQGEGEWSDSVSASPLGVPGKPVVTLSATDTTITATWPAPADNGAAISDYDVQYRRSSETGWTPWTHDGTARSATITGLSKGTDYQVQVRAINSVGAGDWSDTGSVGTTSPPPPTTGTGSTGTGSTGSGRATPAAPRDYFTDDEDSVHEANINLIAREGITAGCDAARRLFCPDEPLTRAQMAVFLVRAMGEIESASYSARFSDVEPDAWYRGYVTRLAELGVTAGFEDGTFRPDDLVTRAQMATFLVAAIDGLNTANPSSLRFSDVTADQAHASAIAGLVAGGVTSGYPDGTFRPDDPVTRGQMATFLAEALDLAS